MVNGIGCTLDVLEKMLTAKNYRQPMALVKPC